VNTDVVITTQNQLGIMTLNRPDALNALTLPMIMTLQQQLIEWLDCPSIHAVVIRSAGKKAFCAGGDVRWLYDAGQRGDPNLLRFFEEEYRLNQMIHHYKKPYIALMDGLTMGGGVGVSLHGSHTVASESFVFAMPETSIGFFPDIGSSYLLSRCPGKMGVYLGLTGNRLNADEAYAFGLVQYVIQSSQFDDVMDELLTTDLSTDADSMVNACLSRVANTVNRDSTMALQSRVDDCFTYRDVISIIDALKKQDDAWSQAILTTLLQKSPLSLSVTLDQLLKAASMSFDDCIQMDFCLVKHFMKGHDFYEGVRALLIDKDKSPKWQPDCLSNVETRVVQEYFK